MKYRELKNNRSVKHLIRDISNNADWLQFFLMFARLEYALKRSGFVKMRVSRSRLAPSWGRHDSLNQQSGIAEADWDKFLRAIGPELENAGTEFQNASHAIITEPPFKQFLSAEGELYWRLPIYGNNNQALANIIKTVRNNLFHGGKYPTMPVQDPSKDIELVRNCVVVLDTFIHSNPQVQAHYFDELQ